MGSRMTGDRPDLASGERIVARDPFSDGATPQMAVSPTVVLDRATLTMLAGPEAGAVFALASAEVVLGRGIDAMLRFDEPSVSRLHAKITHMGRDAYRIEDLDSTNGTYVGGRLIHSVMLHSGDRIQLGGACIF